MSARKFRNRWWVDFRHDFIRYRKKSPVNTRSGAQEYEATLRQRLARGEDINARLVAVKSKTFEEFAWEWFETYVKANNKPSEIRSKESILRVHLVPAFGRKPVGVVGVQVIEEYKGAKLRSGLSAKSINNHLNVLGKALVCAQDWGLLTTLPRIRRLRVAPHSVEYLTPEETRRLVDAPGDPTICKMVLVAVRTGLRLGELSGLSWSDIDTERSQLVVRRAFVYGQMVSPKSNRHRLVPLPADVLDALGPRGADGGALLFPRPDGTPQSPKAARYGLERLCRTAGVRSIGWHVLRHTFATQLVEIGTPLPAVKDLLGHSTITVTERYLHAAPSTLRRAVDSLAEALRSVPERGQPVDTTSTSGLACVSA